MIDLNQKSCDSLKNGNSMIDVGMKQTVKKEKKNLPNKKKKSLSHHPETNNLIIHKIKDSQTIQTIRKQIILPKDAKNKRLSKI